MLIMEIYCFCTLATYDIIDTVSKSNFYIFIVYCYTKMDNLLKNSKKLRLIVKAAAKWMDNFLNLTYSNAQQNTVLEV